MGTPERSPYGRVTSAAMEDGTSRVEALEEIRAVMEVVVLTAIDSARRSGHDAPTDEEGERMIYAASMLGGLRMALALTGREMTEEEIERCMGDTMHLYREMMSDELMQACHAGDATCPIDGEGGA